MPVAALSRVPRALPTSPPALLTGPRGVALHLLAGLAAVVVALLAAWVSRGVWRTSGATIPWGLALGIAGSASAVWLAKAVARSLGFAVAAGWIVGMGIVIVGGPGGDVILLSDGLGYGFLVFGTAAVIIAAGWGSWAR